MVIVSGDQSLREEVLQTKAVEGQGGAFLVCQRPDEGRKSASAPNRIQEGLLPWGLPCLCSGAAGCLLRTGQPCSFLGLLIP